MAVVHERCQLMGHFLSAGVLFLKVFSPAVGFRFRRLLDSIAAVGTVFALLVELGRVLSLPLDTVRSIVHEFAQLVRYALLAGVISCELLSARLKSRVHFLLLFLLRVLIVSGWV